MPVPRKSGAPLQQISLTMPGQSGLNKQSETSILGPQWATTALNGVFDTSGRLAARKGWEVLTTTPLGGGLLDAVQMHEMVLKDGATQIITTGAGGVLYRGVDTLEDITGISMTSNGSGCQFVNYFGNCYGFHQGDQPIVYDGVTAFEDLVETSGTAPNGNCAVVHSGRVWASDGDYQTIKYSALLDATKWDPADGAGSIDMTSVWPGGTDVIMALAFYNGMMFVFGKNRIVMWNDPQGTVLGINPATMVVFDTIIGTGCIARDSIQQIEGGDILFLSSQGVESVERQVTQRNNPFSGVSKNIRDYLNESVALSDKDNIRSVYSPEGAFYLLSIPDAAKAFCFSTTFPNQDGTLRVTEWTGFVPLALCRSIDGNLYASYPGTAPVIGRYAGYLDNGNTYTFQYLSGWMDAGEEVSQYLKILKSISTLLWVSNFAAVSVNWGFDFDPTLFTAPLTLPALHLAEYGLAEYGIDEYAGGQTLRDLVASASGSGQFVRVGCMSTINGEALALQQFNLFTKIGRMAR